MDNRTTIQFSNPTAAHYQFSVIDPSGRRVYFQENISSDRIEFFREDLPSGMYMYELRGPKIHRGKILIK